MSNAVKQCNSCGQSIVRSAQICPLCGAKQGVVQAAPVMQGQVVSGPAVQPSKDKVTAALLAIFLGGLGAHHFYLGNIGRGILYLLFSWTFIPLLAGFIEGIMYLATADNVWLAKYPPLTYR